MDLDALREKNANGQLDSIINSFKKTSGFKKPKFENDANEWRLTLDKKGNGYAVIRFLPAIEEEGVAFVELLSHGFKYNNRWFIENCPKTIGKDCPVCQDRWDIINTYGNWDDVPNDVKKSTLLPRNSKKSYWANILVVKDPANPENDGKVFKFRFGVKIFDKIKDKLIPEMEGEEMLNIFDPKEGANFKLKSKKVSGYANYDSSEFEAPSVLKNAEKVLEARHSLVEIISDDKFKTAEEISRKYFEIVGGKPASSTVENTKPQTVDEAVVSDNSIDASSIEDNSGSDDSNDYFSKLADQLV